MADTTSGQARALPLSRFTILDLTLARAGPTCVRHLADWGAKVIRIDQPQALASGGVTGGARHGPDFQNLHRNKRGIVINLKTPEGLALFMKLAAEADVVVENMRANVKFKLGVDYESVRKVNPKIVYGSISGFGQDGPYATRGGVDQIAQGLGGLMSITGKPGEGPMRVGIPVSDLAAGGYLAQGILMALLDREVTGQGQWVHTSLLESMVAMLDFQAARWTMAGEAPGQMGNDHPTLMPMGVFATGDGHINIAASGQRLYQRLCDVLAMPDLFTDPRFCNDVVRSKNRVELTAIIESVTRQNSSAHWLDLLEDAGIPCGPINSIDQTFNDPQVQHLGLQQSVDHGELGSISIVTHPVNMSLHNRDIRRAAPDPGQHTGEILRELGLSDSDIQTLIQQGAIEGQTS